ncbi:unnamed protein product [Dovyalis caffra]|uniref:Fe2OG dioxygenase domain-containing protein n=1 Tax=Dovyalis caffra TaxID=77055 RepID=A0AAV1QSL8_9ROSI|nr:unnamed protein product [Dovyalis caffra]
MAAKAELISNSVQEMAIKGKEPPVKYFYKGNDGGVLDASVPLIEVPVVDLGLLTSESTSAQELEKLKLALGSWGCFQVINHGMTSSFLDKIRGVSKQFFAFPMEEKQKYSREADSIEGYGNDMIISERQTIDWTDRLYLTISPDDQRKLKFWPENPKEFRETLHEYTWKLQEINEILLRAMARSLNLEESCFLDQYGEQPLVTARFNFYPPCPRPDRILGVKPHADASAITYLLQDKEVEGLQFLKDNEWFRVPIIQHALLINVGDQVEIMSNGIFKSPVHRVVTNRERERNTLAVFCIPESDKEIKPADGLISEITPSLYKKVKDYVSIYFQYYQQGKRPIEAGDLSVCISMADNLFPTKIESQSKSVQELVMYSEEPPERYFYEDGVNGVLDSSLPVLEIPVIDIVRLASPSTRGEEVEKLHSALSSCGCFMSINHGVTGSFLDQVRSITKQFFALPMEEKMKCSREVDSTEGYGNDMILSEDQILDWTDRLYLKVSPEEKRKFMLWPQKPETFREILQEYTAKLKLIVEVVLKAMARSLKLEDNCFLDKYGERAIMIARFNFFPPCPRPDRTLGLKPHADGSAITIVLQDKEVEGLQFLKDDQWFRVPILPHALLINVGDQTEIMSNGLFKSPVHRVVTNSERERTSVAVFCLPDPDNDIEPVDRLVSETRPRLYKKVQDYEGIYFQYYQKGKRPIEAVKL